MIGSYLQFGCVVNTSNYRTASLVNYYRCNGFECLPELEKCWCDSDVDAAPFQYYGNPTELPWYDSEDDASKEYLGKILFGFDGMDSSVYSRNVSQGINGSYADQCRVGAREIVADGMMFALSRRGMEFGKRWEREQLWNGFCGCCSPIVKVRSSCDTQLRELRGFTPTAGPSYSDFLTKGQSCCELVSRVEWTARCVDPAIYGESVEIVRCGFGADPVCEMWDCETECKGSGCEEQCCLSCTPLTDLYSFDDRNCCYCRPLVVVRQVQELPVFSSGMVGVSVKLNSGSELFENARMMIVEAVDEKVFDEFDVAYHVNTLKTAEWNAIPSGVTVIVDGKSKTVFSSCTDAQWLFDEGGLPFDGFFYDPTKVKKKIFFVFEADAFNVAEDAEFVVDVFRYWV